MELLLWVICITQSMNGVKRVWIYVFEVEFLSLLEIMSSVVISPPLGKNTGDDAKALHPLGAMEIGSIFWKTDWQLSHLWPWLSAPIVYGAPSPLIPSEVTFIPSGILSFSLGECLPTSMYPSAL